MINVTKESWQAWRHDPVTKEFFGVIRQLRENLKENLAQDRYQGDELMKVIGQALAIDMVLKAEPDFIEDENDPAWK